MDIAYLRQQIATAEILLDLEPEEFGAHIVEAMRRDNNTQALSAHVRSAFFPDGPDALRGFPRNQRSGVQSAIYEAWSWLEAQGFLIWSDEVNGRNGFRVLSRRGLTIQTSEFPGFAAARAIPPSVIHESIRADVWSDFVRGRYANAVFHAARQVEIAVRNASGAGAEAVGVALMRQAFHHENGALTDLTVPVAEREARAHLFAGFYGAYRNPAAHHDINIDDPEEALELIFVASHLLRIVDARQP